MAIAAVLNLTNDMPFVLALTVICAILLLRSGQNAKMKGDAAVAIISVGALAIGYLLMNIFSTSGNLSGDVCTTLFGSTSILTLTEEEVWLTVVLSVLLISIAFGTPVGSTIVAVDIVSFLFFMIFGRVFGGVSK